MDRRTDPLSMAGVAVVAVLVVAMVVAAVDARSRPGHESLDDPVGTLVDAWATSRQATYRATGTFERRAPDGRSLVAEVEVVQRPPDRLLRQFGEVTGRRGDRVLQCPAPIGEAPLQCRLGPPGASYDDTVATEVEAFRALVAGDDPLYVVTRRSTHCWRMTRTRPDPRSGFGLEAELCVDSAVGAVRSIEIDHGTLTERTVYDDITPEVGDADLEPSPA